MKNTSWPETIKIPNRVGRSRRSVSLSVIALKFQYILLSFAQNGYYSVRSFQITPLIPSMARIDRRSRVLEQLNSLSIVLSDTHEKVKVFAFLDCSDGVYSWGYTERYRELFAEAGIALPT